MPFQFQVLSVEYEDGNTVINGHVISGEVGTPESVILPTAAGGPNRFLMVGMQAPGPDWPIRVGHRGIVQLVLGGHPPAKDILTPCVAVADGRERMPTPVFCPDYGCEIYEGDAAVIGAAVSAGKWDALRNGTAAHSFVGFPRFLIGENFDWLAGAVASVPGQPEVKIDGLRAVAGEPGHSGAYVLPRDWVAAVASVPERHIERVCLQWAEAHLREKDEDQEPWPVDQLLDPLRRLTILCREGVSRQTDVVLLAV